VGVSFVCGIIHLIVYWHDFIDDFGHAILFCIEFAMLQILLDCPTFFFMRQGAATRDARKATTFALISGAIALLAISLAAYYGNMFDGHDHDLGDDKEDDHPGEDIPVPMTVFLVYRIFMMLAYAFIVGSAKILPRRPALTPYAWFMLFYHLIFMLINIGVYWGPQEMFCAAYGVSWLLDGILWPLVLYISFRVDSQVLRVAMIILYYHCLFIFVSPFSIGRAS
jgi:hypothetical protein